MTPTAPVYRGRFAPSPTGPLHLGSLYTALAGFLQARANQGAWHLRIDDIDPRRTVQASTGWILRTLDELGLHWDGPVLYQSQRETAYHDALARLDAQGLVYACTCSRQQLASLNAGLPNPPIYPGYCRSAEPGAEPHALRILTEGRRIRFQDGLQGPVEQDLESEVGDFILFRRDRVYAYHLATVLDDAEQGITDVLRGVDLLESTPRQIFLQQLLGLPPTRHTHIPVLVRPDGRKLSKQTFAPAVATDRPAEILFGLLQRLQQSPPEAARSGTVEDILGWAVRNWDISRLRGSKAIIVR